jgi:hypothetical protein
MKIKKLILLSLLIAAFSCADPGGDPIYNGFVFNFINDTTKELNSKVIIGGFSNGFFTPTDSVSISNIKKGRTYSHPMFVGENRWKPDLEKIRAIPSERCYFKLKLSDGREELLTKYSSIEIFSLQLPNKAYFTGDFGLLSITIDENETRASVAQRVD